jgi:hypothetical protein
MLALLKEVLLRPIFPIFSYLYYLLTNWLPDTKVVLILSLLPYKFFKSIEKGNLWRKIHGASLAIIKDKADINTDRSRGNI